MVAFEFHPGEAVLIVCRPGEVQARGIVVRLLETACECGGPFYRLDATLEGIPFGIDVCASLLRRPN